MSVDCSVALWAALTAARRAVMRAESMVAN